jgi:hypothetical protein
VSRLYAFSLVAVGAFLCLPVLSVDHAPLVDYPNHLARAYILATYAQTAAFVAEYRTVVEPIPNVAIDLLLPALLRFTAIVPASKIFLAILVLLFVLGCHCLGKAIHGQPTWLAIPCCFFVYSSTLLYGYVNYILGVGLYTLALAYWLSHRHRWTGVSLVLATALVFAAYLAHLSAYAFICATVCAVEGFDYLRQGRPARAVVVSLVPLVLPAVAFAAFMRGSGEVGGVEWNSVSGKLVPLLTVFVSYSPILDGLAILSTATLVASVVAHRQRFAVNPPIFISGLVLFLLYCLSPKGLFTSSGVDARFILPAILLCALSVRMEVPSRAVAIALCACVLVFGLRVGGIWHTWLQLDRRITAEVERLMVLPAGARVYPVFATSSDRTTAKRERSFQHVVQYATIYRHAFLPTLFALPGQQPLLFRRAPKYASPSNQDKTAWLRHMEGYDYVWSYGISPELKQAISARGRMIREVDGFGLWQLTYTD